MRLLNTIDLQIGEFMHDQIPPYAILSHTWGEDEVTLQDMQRSCGINKEEYKKVINCCFIARANGFDYVWIDTCCIDKTSSAELSEAINSMYRWYEEADICYAYLADVPPKAGAGDEFRRSKWFTRGWTLQELIAPSTVEFFNSEWQTVGDKLGLQQIISDITGIPVSFILGDDLKYASVAQKMSWAARRKTTRIEDIAYCLMGIFGIYMPMLYGEGERAFIRLQEEILKVTNDQSLFAWRSTEEHGGILATSPAAFEMSGNIISTGFSDTIRNPPMVTSRGIRLSLRLRNTSQGDSNLAILDCMETGGGNKRLAIYLQDVFLTKQDFTRAQSSALELLDFGSIDLLQYPLADLYVRQWDGTYNQKRANIEKCAIRMKSQGEGKYNPVFHPIYLHPNWEVHDGLMVTVTTLPANGILGRLLVVCNDGNSFQVVLKKRGMFITADIHHNLDIDAETVQESIASDAHQHERDRIVGELSDGRRVHVTIQKRIIMLQNEKHFMGVVEINYPSMPGAWLQHVAVLEGDIEQTKLLVYAVKRGYDAIVKLLGDAKKLDGEIKDENGMSVVSLAASNGHETIVRLLLANQDYDINFQREERAMELASRNGHYAILKLFLEKKDPSGLTGLDWVVQRPSGLKLLALLGWSTGPNTKNNNGQILRLQDVKNQRDSIVDILLRSISDPGVEKKFKSLFFWGWGWPTQKQHEAIVKRLLESGADPEAKDIYGLTLLGWAVQNECEAIVMLLLQRGANVDARDNLGLTPLGWAAWQGCETIARLLLDGGADLEAKDAEGQTPLFLAFKNDRWTVTGLLLARGANLDGNSQRSTQSKQVK